MLVQDGGTAVPTTGGGRGRAKGRVVNNNPGSGGGILITRRGRGFRLRSVVGVSSNNAEDNEESPDR